MSLLEKIQQHYQEQCLFNQRLGDLPKIEDSEWVLKTQEAQALLDWILSQKWQYQQIKIYDSIYGLESSALQLLSTMVRKGFAMHPTVHTGAENKVFLANACAMGVFCEKMPHEYFSYVVDAAKYGHPLLLAIDFNHYIQWVGNFALTEMVLKRIANVSENDVICSPYQVLSNNLMDALEDDDEPGHSYCQWLQTQSDQPWAPKLLAHFAYSTWYWNGSPHCSSPPERVNELNERSQRFLKDYPQWAFEKSLEVAKQNHSDGRYIDSLISLCPSAVQNILLDDDFLDNQPNTQQLRFNRDLKDSVACFGATPVTRKM